MNKPEPLSDEQIEAIWGAAAEQYFGDVPLWVVCCFAHSIEAERDAQWAGRLDTRPTSVRGSSHEMPT